MSLYTAAKDSWGSSLGKNGSKIGRRYAIGGALGGLGLYSTISGTMENGAWQGVGSPLVFMTGFEMAMGRGSAYKAYKAAKFGGMNITDAVWASRGAAFQNVKTSAGFLFGFIPSHVEGEAQFGYNTAKGMVEVTNPANLKWLGGVPTDIKNIYTASRAAGSGKVVSGTAAGIRAIRGGLSGGFAIAKFGVGFAARAAMTSPTLWAFAAAEVGMDIMQNRAAIARRERIINFGTPIRDPYGTVATIRQQSLSMIQQSGFNVRTALGNEAQFMHNVFG